jgi:hypothetical protein
LLTLTADTTPSLSALILFSIFIASRIAISCLSYRIAFFHFNVQNNAWQRRLDAAFT